MAKQKTNGLDQNTISARGVPADIQTIDSNTSIGLPVSMGGTSGKEFNIDDMIPEELKAAVLAQEKEDGVEPGSTVAPVATEDLEEDDLLGELDDNEPVSPPIGSYQEEDETEAPTEDEDLDLSSENIDKFISGDITAFNKKKQRKEDSSDTSSNELFWKKEEGYKKLIPKLAYGGVSEKQLNEFIQGVFDKRIVDNAQLVKGLEEERNSLAADKDAYLAEIERLRSVERATRFDLLPETAERYGKPMSSAAKEIKRILDIEGAGNVSLNNLLLAKDKSQFMKLIDDVDFSDDSLTQLTNHWRSYKEMQFKYDNDKKEALLDLNKFLSTNIPQEATIKVLRNSLVELLESDVDRYKPLRDAINNDIRKNPEMSEVLASARNSMEYIMQAISDPSVVAHNEKWMSGTAKYFYNAQYNAYLAKQLGPLQQENAELKKNNRKLAMGYKALAESGKGVSGKKTGGGVFLAGKNGNSHSEQLDSAEKEYEALLNNTTKIEDIMPGLR